MLPRRHILALDELSHAEAAALGPLLRAVTAALREVTGCAKTYVALFAEAEGFGHVHFHVVPRRHGVPLKPAASFKEDPAVLSDQALKLTAALKG